MGSKGMKRSFTPTLHLYERDAAVDVNRLAGDEIAQRRCEKQHRSHHVVGYLYALERAQADRRFSELDHLFGRIFFRQRVAGREAIHIDIIIPDFPRQRARETDGGSLRRHVMDSSRRAGKNGSRSDGDDLAGFLFAHGRQHGTTAKKRPRRFTAISRSHSSGSMVSILPRFIGTTEKTAALFTSTSILPKRSRTPAAIC